MVNNSQESLGHNASSPIVLAQPIADLSRTAFNVFVQHQADAADGFAADVNGKIGFYVFCQRSLDKLFSVGRSVGVGKTVPHVAPDLDVIGMTRQGLFV